MDDYTHGYLEWHEIPCVSRIDGLDPKHLGLRIRQAREHLSLSQEDLAAAVGKDQGAVSEYENGRRKLAVTDLPRFATVLEVPLSYFFEEEAPVYELDEAMLTISMICQVPKRGVRLSTILRIFSRTLRGT